MKKVLVLMVLVATGGFAFAQATATATKEEVKPEVAVFEWAAQSYDFGKIKQGTPATHEFKFKNTGKVPLVITNVQASCGCTTPDWSKEPIAPGAEGFIKATYNAANMGGFNKTVTVMANVENSYMQLSIKGEVVQENP
jgi:Protein of unknown function (DUF1573)